MRYRLVVLTQPHSPTLAATLESFREHVTPAPTDEVLVEDGQPATDAALWMGMRVCTGKPQGFCGATAVAWEAARSNRGETVDYVFHLEEDFTFTRSVNLDAIAHVLSLDWRIAQMALMRQPVNPTEVAAGGLVESRPHTFTPRWDEQGNQWLEHNAYWTTNPSLIPVSIPRSFEWPLVPECEGRFTQLLRDGGYRFGVWGTGETWVRHTGERRGFGY
jgi:hypothetical protein